MVPKLDSYESRSEIPGRLWNVVLEKDGKDKLNRLCEKRRSITEWTSTGITYKQQNEKAKWVGYTWHSNCLLRHVIEGKTEGRIEVTGRRGRIRKHLLDDLKAIRGFWKLKVEALERTLWKTHFRRGYGPVVRQTTEWMTRHCEFNDGLRLT